jgi:hypothetical protein
MIVAGFKGRHRPMSDGAGSAIGLPPAAVPVGPPDHWIPVQSAAPSSRNVNCDKLAASAFVFPS